MRLSLKERWKKGAFHRFEIIAAILFLAALIPSLRGVSSESDVDIFHGAAIRLRDGFNMYLAPYMYGMWYYYSPLFASILVPFTYLDIRVLKLVWYLFNLFLVFRCYQLLFGFLPMGNNKKDMYVIACIAVFSIHPVFLNLLYGQLTILVLWSCMEGVQRFYNHQKMKGAFSFAIGINIKMLPVFFFYYYAVKRNFKAIFFMVFALLVLILLPYLWLRSGFHSELIGDWLSLLNPLNPEHVNTVGEGGFTDFASILTKYLTFHPIKGEATFNITNLSNRTIFIMQMGFRVFILILSAWVILKVHSKLFTNKIKEFADMAFILACIPAAFPHQRDYSVMLCVPAMGLLAFIWFLFNEKPNKYLVYVCLFSITLMGSTIFLELLGNRLKFLLFQTRTSGFGVLLFLLTYVLIIFNLKVKNHDNLSRVE